MAPRMTRLKHRLVGLWTGLNQGLRRALRRGEAAEPVEAHDAFADPQEHGESDMSEHNEIDADAANQPEASHESEEGLEAALASMQSELASLTDILTNEESDAAPGPRPVEATAEVEDDAFDELDAADEETTLADALAGIPDGEEESQADDLVADAGDDALIDEATLAEAVEGDPDTVADFTEDQITADAESLHSESSQDVLSEVETAARVASKSAAPVEQAVDTSMAEDVAYDESPAASIAGAAAQASVRSSSASGRGRMTLDDIDIPQPSQRTERAGRRRSGSVQADAVSGAILQLAAFMQDEVNGLWEESRVALQEMLDYRDRMQQATDRVETLEAEIRALRDDLRQSRQEARQLQSQMQNIRDDASRARQRADTAAMDAQSAADRAISAAREIESSASLSRGC